MNQKIFKIGKGAIGTDDSFIGTLGAVSLSCRLPGSSRVNEPYYGLATLTSSSFEGMWLLDQNPAGIIENFTNRLTKSPFLEMGGTPPSWDGTNNWYTFNAG